MPIPSAESSFRKGLATLTGGDAAAAARHLQSAILIERQHGVARPQMRYLSYYGLALAQSGRPNAAAIQACETATRRDLFNPDLYLNLGRVYSLADRKSRALAAFERGLAIAPNHPALASEMAKIDRRQAPPLAFVPRSHPINKLLGKVRGVLFARRAHGMERAKAAPAS